MQSKKIHKMTIAALFVALGIILPYCTAHGLGIPGTVLLPMHIPVFLIGFICGPLYGGCCGLLIPCLNSLLTGMPSVFPMLPIMSAELCMYGWIGGILYGKTCFGKMRFGIYPALIFAMIGGRVVYGLVFALLNGLNGSLQALTVWAALSTGLPGIIVQLLLVPAVVKSLAYMNERRGQDALASAKTLLKEGRATCFVIQHNQIVRTACARGIGPIIQLYEEGWLKDAFVADKIIGKAAAMIMVLGGVKHCYGEVMSEAGKGYLEKHGVKAEYGELIAHIQNRANDGMCPMEQAVEKITDPDEGLDALKRVLASFAASDPMKN
ncbi:MAG: DUF1893 domain-containing protein [Clostridiales bacterium]|nr:DUF1893 domain-containing protein [Clostridiales bacterium]